MSYDTKCADLAEHFLGEDYPATEANIKQLAQAIQDAIEDELSYLPDKKGGL